jgi:hypothetical protein
MPARPKLNRDHPQEEPWELSPLLPCLPRWSTAEEGVEEVGGSSFSWGFAGGVSEMPRQSTTNRGDDGFIHIHMSSIQSSMFVLALSDCFTSGKKILAHP